MTYKTNKQIVTSKNIISLTTGDIGGSTFTIQCDKKSVDLFGQPTVKMDISRYVSWRLEQVEDLIDTLIFIHGKLHNEGIKK